MTMLTLDFNLMVFHYLENIEGQKIDMEQHQKPYHEFCGNL